MSMISGKIIETIDVIILGANGQLGSDLVRVFLEKNGNNAIGNNKINLISLTRKDLNFHLDNITQDTLTELLVKYLPKTSSQIYIINCIAITNVDGCEHDSTMAFAINSSFAFQLAKFCNNYNITLFHISTDYIFSGTSLMPYVEEAIPEPINIYGLSKYAGETAVALYHDKYFIFRVSGLFGVATASGKGGNFITTMQRLGTTRDVVSVIADQITCPTSTLEIARAIHTFINNNVISYGVYNCVSSNSCSWFEFAQEIFKLTGLDANKLQKSEFAKYPFVAKRPQYTILNTDKISQYYKMAKWQDSLVEYFNLLIND